MRNFHRDFESLNAAYTQSVRTKQKTHQVVHESVSQDMDRLHRAGSIKQLREAMKMLAAAHHKDHSSLTMEDCYAEMKAFAEENLAPQPGAIPAIPDQGPDSQLHNEPVRGLASEKKEFDHDGDGDEDEDDYMIHKDKMIKKNMHKEDSHDKKDHDKKDHDKKDHDKKMGKYDDGDGKEEKCDYVPCKEEKIEETDHSTLRAAQTDEENFEDDRKAAGLKKQGEIMKKDLEDEEKESSKKKVGENFDKMLELLKLSDQVQNESDDEEDENKEELEEDMNSFMQKQMQPGGDRKAKISSGDINMAKDLATAAGGPTGNAVQKLMGQDGPTKIRKAYGNLMGAVADKLTKATKELSKNNPA